MQLYSDWFVLHYSCGLCHDVDPKYTKLAVHQSTCTSVRWFGILILRFYISKESEL